MRRFEIVDKKFIEYNNDNITLPIRSTSASAGYDFYSPVKITVKSKDSVMLWTNVKACMENDEFLQLHIRSSLGKRKIMLSNCVGIIDADYYNNDFNDGNIGFILYNYGNNDYEINIGDRIAQGIFLTYLKTDNEEDVLMEKRGGGIGSTKK